MSAVSYSISRDFTFAASHVLDTLPVTHKCSRMHGHNYIVRVELETAQLDDNGFVMDYGELTRIVQPLISELDHRHLNDLMNGLPATAEHLARQLLDSIARTLHDKLGCKGPHFGDPHVRSLRDHGWALSVGVSETPKTWAWCRA